MHPDLVAISNLWQIDHRNDVLRAEHEGLSLAVRTADAAQRAAEARLVELDAQRDTNVAATRKNDRELADYAEKRDRTRKMIETGTAPDYAAAERQLAQVLDIVDRLETTALEHMEVAESLVSARLVATRELDDARRALVEARAALAARDADIRAELTALIAKRPPFFDALPHEHRGGYAQLRQRKRPALVNTKDNMCQVCQTKIPAQRCVETALARAVHTCPGCLGWLLP